MMDAPIDLQFAPLKLLWNFRSGIYSLQLALCALAVLFRIVLVRVHEFNLSTRAHDRERLIC